MPRPTRNEIYEAVIRKMVMQALEEQELQFTRDHAFDTDEELLDYIREYAAVFHYAPRYKEIIGWKLITERFGSWGAAIEKAGLHLSSSCPVERLPRIQEEVRKQKELYRQRKAEKKILSEQRRLQQEAKRSSQKEITYLKVCVPPT